MEPPTTDVHKSIPITINIVQRRTLLQAYLVWTYLKVRETVAAALWLAFNILQHSSAGFHVDMMCVLERCDAYATHLLLSCSCKSPIQ